MSLIALMSFQSESSQSSGDSPVMQSARLLLPTECRLGEGAPREVSLRRRSSIGSPRERLPSRILAPDLDPIAPYQCVPRLPQNRCRRALTVSSALPLNITSPIVRADLAWSTWAALLVAATGGLVVEQRVRWGKVRASPSYAYTES